jgi:hypothetical protein
MCKHVWASKWHCSSAAACPVEAPEPCSRQTACSQYMTPVAAEQQAPLSVCFVGRCLPPVMLRLLALNARTVLTTLTLQMRQKQKRRLASNHLLRGMLSSCVRLRLWSIAGLHACSACSRRSWHVSNEIVASGQGRQQLHPECRRLRGLHDCVSSSMTRCVVACTSREHALRLRS